MKSPNQHCITGITCIIQEYNINLKGLNLRKYVFTFTKLKEEKNPFQNA